MIGYSLKDGSGLEWIKLLFPEKLVTEYHCVDML